MYILGISAFYHDSAAALIKDGVVVAAAQEERFSRKKGDSSLPIKAVGYCLEEAGVDIKCIDHVVYYEDPFKKFSRLVSNYLFFAPRGSVSFVRAMRSFLAEKLWIGSHLKGQLGYKGEVYYLDHHLSHASSAFYPSPFSRAAIMTIDGVGEWSTLTIGEGSGSSVKLLDEMRYPHSVGMLYSAFTHYAGFKVNSGEYKLMGLAPYGEGKYVDLILDKIVSLNEDGTFQLNLEYFDYCTGTKMTNSKFHRLFGGVPRIPESLVTQKEMDIAKSVQIVLEEIYLRLARTAKKKTGARKLCLAGGVALNCVANGKLLKENIFDDIWIQPAAGDAGGALGCALYMWYGELGNGRRVNERNDGQKGSYLGPRYSNNEIRGYLDKNKSKYERIDDPELQARVAYLVSDHKVVGLFRGRMEYGPRALGNRSIIGDARSSDMQSVMNLKIKFRESFRPFAPAILEEYAGNYFVFPKGKNSPYMLLTADVKNELRTQLDDRETHLWGMDKLRVKRSLVPAITHVDYSARLQTVNRDASPFFYSVIDEFRKITGYPIIINTSFNVRGEPIVCSYEDAYRCFMRTEMDCLVLENFLLFKKDQPKLESDVDWKARYQLD